jgi:hypothetical protein
MVINVRRVPAVERLPGLRITVPIGKDVTEYMEEG